MDINAETELETNVSNEVNSETDIEIAARMYSENNTFQVIADELGVSRAKAQRMVKTGIREALEKLIEVTDFVKEPEPEPLTATGSEFETEVIEPQPMVIPQPQNIQPEPGEDSRFETHQDLTMFSNEMKQMQSDLWDDVKDALRVVMSGQGAGGYSSQPMMLKGVGRKQQVVFMPNQDEAYSRWRAAGYLGDFDQWIYDCTTGYDKLVDPALVNWQAVKQMREG